VVLGTAVEPYLRAERKKGGREDFAISYHFGWGGGPREGASYDLKNKRVKVLGVRKARLYKKGLKR